MRRETHMPPLDLPFGDGTNVRWSKKPAGQLLVFVHGFKGGAVSTWGGYPDQLCLHPEASGYDVVRFGYDSVGQTAAESAGELQRFLDELLVDHTVRITNRSVEEYDASLKRKSDWRYNRLVLVGHSLGACVVRRAVLNQLRSGKRWPMKKKLVWFAPAHRGARLMRLLTAVSVGIPIGGLDAAAKFFSPVLGDLEEESVFLKTLLEQTNDMCGSEPELKAPLTFWAWKDKVVVNDDFAQDKTPPEQIRGVSHVSICKSTRFDKTVAKMLKEL